MEENESIKTYEANRAKCRSFNKYNQPDMLSFYNVLETDSRKSSLPNEGKYVRRSSLQSSSKKYGKSKENKPRPRPLQADNAKYYEHIFPERYARFQRQSYQPERTSYAEL